MLYVHPVIMALTNLLAVYVFVLGLNRFRGRRLGQKVLFQWPRHVGLGLIAGLAWLGGAAGGGFVAYLTWHRFLATDDHGEVGLVMVPLILFGLLSGLYLDRRKKKRTFLPLLHGLNNTVLLGLALSQFYTGWLVLRTLRLGY